MKTEVVNIRNDDYDIYCARVTGGGGLWGNPFRIGADGTREEVIEKYKNWIQTRPDLLALIPTLKGKRLGCFCSPKACHCNILAELADAPPEPVDQDGLFKALEVYATPPPAPPAPRRVIDLSSGNLLDIRNL